MGVKLFDICKSAQKELYAQIVVNASGVWGKRIAQYADLNINMLPSKGSLLIFGHRVNRMVLNRCRKPSDADILVPGDMISLIGTTSQKLPYNKIDDIEVTFDEVNTLITEGAKLSPELMHTRILRAYAGVRPLIAESSDSSGRSVSRGVALFDHQERDSMEGLITISGGQLMTYR